MSNCSSYLDCNGLCRYRNVPLRSLLINNLNTASLPIQVHLGAVGLLLLHNHCGHNDNRHIRGSPGHWHSAAHSLSPNQRQRMPAQLLWVAVAESAVQYLSIQITFQDQGRWYAIPGCQDHLVAPNHDQDLVLPRWHADHSKFRPWRSEPRAW